MSRPRCDRTSAWTALQSAFATQGRSFDLRTAFAGDAQRFEAFSQSAPHVFADLSKNLLDAPTERLLFDLARQCELPQHRDAMFAGQAINATEQRAAMHWLLRYPDAGQNQQAQSAIQNVASELTQVHATLGAMLAYAETVDNGKPIRETLNADIPLAVDHFRYFAGVLRAEEIAGASDRIACIVMATSDLVTQLHARRTPDRIATTRRILRGSKEIAETDWVGSHYETKFATDAALLAHLDKAEVDVVFVDLSMPADQQKPHETKLKQALATAPQVWEKLPDQPVKRLADAAPGTLEIYRRIRPTP